MQAFRGVNAEGGSIIGEASMEVIRRGDLRPDVATLSAEVIAPGEGDSVQVRVIIENASPFALDEAQIHMWQENMDLADSLYLPLAAGQRDTVRLDWRVIGSGEVAAYLSVHSAGLDEDTEPLNNTVRFTYANGVVSVVAVEPSEQASRVKFYARSCPNPTRGAATIRFGLPMAGRVLLRVFNVAGRVVATLVDGELPDGEHAVIWDRRQRSGGAAPAGVYFCELRAGERRTAKPIVVLN